MTMLGQTLYGHILSAYFKKTFFVQNRHNSRTLLKTFEYNIRSSTWLMAKIISLKIMVMI